MPAIVFPLLPKITHLRVISVNEPKELEGFATVYDPYLLNNYHFVNFLLSPITYPCACMYVFNLGPLLITFFTFSVNAERATLIKN